MNILGRFIVFASAAIIISACNPPRAPVSQASAPSTPRPARIAAGPNPVPAGTGTGTTTIKWTTGDGTTGNVFVSEAGAEEHPFAAGPEGSSDAPWIQSGKSYEFRLYNSDHTKLLGKVTVTRAAQ